MQPPTTYVTHQQPPPTAPAIQQLQPQTSQPQAASAIAASEIGNQVALGPTRRPHPVRSAAASLETTYLSMVVVMNSFRRIQIEAVDAVSHVLEE